MRFYYYTRWKFLNVPGDLDEVGPFHSTWETDRNPREFLADTDMGNLSEFFIKVFERKEDMEAYWERVHVEVDLRTPEQKEWDEERRWVLSLAETTE